MANDILNVVLFEGDFSEVTNLRNFIKGSEDCIDFNTICKMPSELDITSNLMSRDITKFMDTVSLKYYGNLEEAILKELPKNINGQSLPYIKNYLMYGHTDWYSWCVEHWGTKWNARLQKEISEKEIEFQTAWHTPTKIMLALSKQFPGIKIHVKYADDDIGNNCGYYTIQNSKFIDTYECLDENSEEFACTLWGYDYNEYKEQYL